MLRDPEYTHHELQSILGYRSTLGVPLLRENTLLGIFAINRIRVEPFTEKEIELASTFADQAVIAIENARLFEELRERQAELRVTFDNMGDGVAMFDASTRLAAWNRNFQEILELPDDFLAGRPAMTILPLFADRGEYSADLEAELTRANEDPWRELRVQRTRPDGRVVEVRREPVPGGGLYRFTATSQNENVLRKPSARRGTLPRRLCASCKWHKPVWSTRKKWRRLGNSPRASRMKSRTHSISSTTLPLSRSSCWTN